MQPIAYDMEQMGMMPGYMPANPVFEKKYISLRQKEQRIYSDEEVFNLPVVSRNDAHYKEWKLREQSCKRLVAYLEKKQRPLKILEVGCGNGWLSHRIAAISGAFVTGIDINLFELRQAARVFGAVHGLQFVYGSIDSDELQDRHFDIIVFAASIQYFHSFTKTIGHSSRLLKEGGEIHILDTHFYKLDEIVTASQRTASYFNDQGFPEMTGLYFHHCINELNAFDPQVHYKPSFLNRFFQRNTNPFSWMSIKKEQS